MTAQQAQQDTRDLTARVFELRNDWTRQNIKITAAEKSTLVATVYTDTENRQTGAKDYLPGQEDGFDRVPVAGRSHIAIPTRYLRNMVGNKAIPDYLRPKALMRYADQNGKYEVTRGKKRGSLRRSPTTIAGMVFFLPMDSTGQPVPMKGGALAIMGRNVGDSKRAYPMYLLVTDAHIKARFPMIETVQATVGARIGPNFDRAAAEVMANEALRGSGFRLKI